MGSDEEDALRHFSGLIKVSLFLAVLATAYYVWSFYVSSRYQALCGASYWEMDRAQVDSCEDVKTELSK